MSTVTHSPAPFSLKEHHSDFSIEDANGRTVAYIGQFLNDVAAPLSMEEIRANAVLLNASAELLAALKEAVEGCVCSVAQRNSGHLLSCRAPTWQTVIEQAEGRT